MAYIRYADEENANDVETAAALHRHRNRHGGVDNILRIHGHHPPTLEAHVALYRTLMFGRSPLSRVQREMLAVVVAAALRCHY